jgi:hypothetical protein
MENKKKQSKWLEKPFVRVVLTAISIFLVLRGFISLIDGSRYLASLIAIGLGAVYLWTEIAVIRNPKVILQNEIEKIKNPDHELMWKSARWGVIIFCVIHLVFENAKGNYQNAALPVIFNYFISGWYIRREIAKGKEIKNLLLMGLSVSCVVFLIRLALGVVFTVFMTK